MTTLSCALRRLAREAEADSTQASEQPASLPAGTTTCTKGCGMKCARRAAGPLAVELTRRRERIANVDTRRAASSPTTDATQAQSGDPVRGPLPAVSIESSQGTVGDDVARLRDALIHQFTVSDRRTATGRVLLFVSADAPSEIGRSAPPKDSTIQQLLRTLAAALAGEGGANAILIDSSVGSAFPVMGGAADQNPQRGSSGASSEGLAIRSLIRPWIGLARLIESADLSGPTPSPAPSGSQPIALVKASLHTPAVKPIELASLVEECRQAYAWTLIYGGRWEASTLSELVRRSDGIYIMLKQAASGEVASRRALRELQRVASSDVGCLFLESSTLQSQAA